MFPCAAHCFIFAMIGPEWIFIMHSDRGYGERVVGPGVRGEVVLTSLRRITKRRQWKRLGCPASPSPAQAVDAAGCSPLVSVTARRPWPCPWGLLLHSPHQRRRDPHPSACPPRPPWSLWTCQMMSCLQRRVVQDVCVYVCVCVHACVHVRIIIITIKRRSG